MPTAFMQPSPMAVGKQEPVDFKLRSIIARGQLRSSRTRSRDQRTGTKRALSMAEHAAGASAGPTHVNSFTNKVP